MTQTYSRPRQRAEIAFGEVQKQFFAKDRAVEELDSIVLAREVKTLRLREARLAKEAQDRASATGALLAKHAKADDEATRKAERDRLYADRKARQA